MNAYAVADRILIDVADNCGGLSPGDEEALFRPFTQPDTDKQGLGLSIFRRSVAANDGVLSVQDVPGTGCIFTIGTRCQMQGGDLAKQRCSSLMLAGCAVSG